MHSYLVRPATDEDASFLRDLFFHIRGPEFAQSGLDEEALNQLLSQQYRAMRDHYDREFSDAEYFVYEQDGQPFGYHATIGGDSIHILDISIHESRRGQGIGTERMKAIMDDAALNSKPVTLTVELFNPAKRLYERLGFEPYDLRGIYQRMRWTPHSRG